ncbi:SEN1 N terminal-domain-containing protein [Hygrophoropsis aurantiaca]|uniref:SEN1 N terminal-domain-containing protein n=1 Tax=Hygrophoropsis aurantiaca TaxID=72124 RepID=A0ACB8A6K7_9AGAM|nr:SEN1 N terminal-domain-containing protein [Hygrophoropsis aurantiaca]
MTTSAGGHVSKVKALLATVRDNPANTADAKDNVLEPVFIYLMGVSPNTSDNKLHWFCNQADQVTVEAATFLLRLFAYNSSQVDKWKTKLKTCLAGCCACVKGLGEVKTSSKTTYFGAFSEDVLKTFYQSFSEWELSVVLEILSRVGVGLDSQQEVTPLLQRVPPAVLYHMVSNMHILKDARIFPLVRSCPPTSGWPIDPPPPGILPLMMDESFEVRQWAKAQGDKCSTVPMLVTHFVTAHEEALAIIAAALEINQTDQPKSFPVGASSSSTINDATRTFKFASGPYELWSGFCQVLRHIPSSMLLTSHLGTDCRRIVTGHLHDVGTQFTDVFRCLLFLLKRLGKQLWQGEGPEFPQVVFDAIKDNPSYALLIQGIQPGDEKPWFLSWFGDFLDALPDTAIYGEVLAKIVDFLCEELQHERFQETRPIIMHAAVRLLASLIRKSKMDSSSSRRNGISSVLDIHADMFISVAFGRSYSNDKWIPARIKARELTTCILSRDVIEIQTSMTRSFDYLGGRRTDFPVCSIREEFWKKTYASIQTSDADGIVNIISVIAQYSHLDLLNKQAYKSILSRPNAQTSLGAFQRSLTITRDGFLETVSKFANYNPPSFLLSVLRRPGVAQDVMTLMLSPIDDIQAAAKTFVGQAFDVDVRLDCFRALLANLPDPSLEGISSFLERFVAHAPLVTEACSFAKSLVRCFTDIIEVLCSSPDGLLHDKGFLKPDDKNGPAAQLPRLWSLMTNSITVIFKRTPAWAEYFEIPDMTVWMRDALIFGRDMLAQWRTIESAAITISEDSSSAQGGSRQKLSRTGRKMINDFQQVLLELARWLRLTDEELLHQSFALIQSLLDCFRRYGVAPLEASLIKLNKHVEDARKKPSGVARTRLDATRISKLEDALSAFDSDDDVVEIVSHTIAPKRTVPETRTAVPVKHPVQQTLKANAKPSAPLLPSKPRHTGQNQMKDVEPAFPAFRRTVDPNAPGSTKPSTAGKISERSSKVAETSSSESDSDDGDSRGLAALGKLQKSPKIQKPAERRQVKMLDVTNQGKSAMHERINRRDDARRRTLRLKPDISALYRALLSWNYDHDGPDPPISDQKPRLHVPNRFSDYDQYFSTFEPLLLLECWSQIVQSKEEKQESYDCKLNSRQFTDDFLDLDCTISNSVQKDWRLGEMDVVLLKHPDGKKSILAKTQSYRQTPFGAQITLRCFVNANAGDPGLQINTTWSLKKVFSLSTLYREYGALKGLPFFDLSQTILQPSIAALPTLDSREVRQTMTTYSVNEPQAKAILGSLRVEGFALIQGPPGTGKTSTICGLVEAFLTQRPRPVTAIHAGRSADKGPVKKILLCAPSNAAIDEVASRLKEGYRGPDRKGTVPKVVRVGAEKAVTINVKDVSLDYLVEQKINSESLKDPSKEAANEVAVLRVEIESVKRAKQEKLEELATVHDNYARTIALEEEIKKLNSRRMTLTQQFDRLKDKQKSDSRTMDAVRRRFRMEILQEADVICSTLSGAGHEILEQLEFEMVIIDEAAQAIELSSLIPLKFSCQRCIMVGDPQQLPPTVLSQEACKYQYNQSLFVRLQKQRPEAVHLLSIQYRMHPDISQLPSRIFYQGRLLDGPDMAIKTKQPWHSHPKFGTYRFFNISRGQEESALGHSLKNTTECQVAVALYSRLCKEFSAVDFDFRVGIVSMYRGQVSELKRAFEQRFGRDITGKIHFHTVDGFQGQEKDIIILSCVRAGPGVQSVGFLADTRRMNVALTRAKSSVYILGNAPTLERSDENWRNIVHDARSRSFLTDADVSYFTAPNKGGAISHLPPSTKPVKSQPQPPPPPKPPSPLGLATPKEMAATSSTRPISTSKTMHNLETLPSEVLPEPVEKSQPQNHKRQLDVSKDELSKPSTSTAQETRMKPPPAKRQKKEKGSIFIPKKSKK